MGNAMWWPTNSVTVSHFIGPYQADLVEQRFFTKYIYFFFKVPDLVAFRLAAIFNFKTGDVSFSDLPSV